MNYKKEGFTWELSTLYVEIEKKEKARPFTCNVNQNAKWNYKINKCNQNFGACRKRWKLWMEKRRKKKGSVVEDCLYDWKVRISDLIEK